MNRVLPGHLLEPGLRGHSARLTVGVGSFDDPTLPTITLPNSGKCPHRPKLRVTVFDDSGSVTGVGGADPIGQRYREAAIAVEHVGRRCRCKQELVAVLHFDRGTGGDAGPCLLDKPGRAELHRALQIPANGYGVSLISATLDDAYDLARRYPDHDKTLVAFTDFELFDPPGTLERFRDFPGEVHAVVLRAAPPQELIDDKRVTVSRITYDSPAGSVARALFDAMRPGTGTNPAKKKEA